MVTFYYVLDSSFEGFDANKIQKRSMFRSFKKLCKKKNINFKLFSVSTYFSFESKRNFFVRRFFKCLVFLKLSFFFLRNMFAGNNFFYIRGELSLFALFIFLFFKKINFAFEIHNFEINDDFKSKIVKYLMKEAAFVVAISKLTSQDWIKSGIDKNKIVYLPSGVDVDKFNFEFKDPNRLKRKFELPLDKKIIMYTGQLLSWKGVDVLIRAFQKGVIETEDKVLVVVGGSYVDIKKCRDLVKNKQKNQVIFLGQREHKEVPLLLKTADVLVLPNTAKEEISNTHTSPIKLFEYMASGKPIIASDIPSIRQVVSEEEVIFFTADDEDDLAGKINYAFLHEKQVAQIAKNAAKRAFEFDWENRAMKIINLILRYEKS